MGKRMTKQERANRAFDRLPAAKRRVEIAKDVLAQMAASKIVAAHTYLGLVDTRGEYPLNLVSGHGNDESLQNLLPKVATCNVCAKGALFVAAVGKRNQVTVGEARDMDFGGTTLAEKMGNAFTPAQLNRIEAAYEGFRSYPDSKYVVPYRVNSYMHGSSQDRLAAIMRNIVKNKGYFRPSQEVNK